MAKRGARVGAAAFALGLSLAGPQAPGVAAADVDPDSGQPTAGADARPAPPPKAQANRGPKTASSGQPAAGPRPAAAQATIGGETADTADQSGGAPRASTTPAGAERPGSSRHARAKDRGAAQTTGQQVPAATAPAPGEAVATPGPAAAGDPVPSAAASVASAVRATVNRRSGPVSPPAAAAVAAAPAATLGAAVGGLLDSAVRWVTRLPAGPVAEFLQGALLLVRRTLAGFLPGIGSAQTGGQTTAAPTYLTESELRSYLLALAQQRYGSLFGQTVPHYEYGYKWLNGALVPAGGRDGVVSDTNTQVDGVDEADFVETDGRYVYVARNGWLTILDTDTAGASQAASQTALSGSVVGQFLYGDRLTVITQTGGGWYGPMVRMAYGPWWNTNPQTTVSVYDVSDPAAPVLAAQTVFDGAYRDSRAVNGTVYLVLDRSLALPAPLYTEVPEESAAAADRGRYRPGPTTAGYRTYETWESYVARVGVQITTLALPHAYAVDAEGNQVDLGALTEAGSIVRPDAPDQQSLLTLLSIDSAGGSGFASGVGTFTSPGGATVYMTPEALYLATTHDEYSETASTTSTRIDRFVINGTEIGWQAAGFVPGALINQFAMDERDGHLRVATHTWNSQWAGGTWATVNDSGVYVLDTAGDELDLVGSLTGLAPGEQLYAVRFVGGKAYLVTFLQTDPLFAIDLADPANPTLEGELVIPGFSNYLQSVGDGLLLGLGQEREPGTWNTRFHVSLFDVSDGAGLNQISRQFLDGDAQWSWSEAQFDHHALLYSAEDGLLVVPVAASGYDPTTGAYRYDQTLQILRVGPGGFETLGVIHTDGGVVRTVRVGEVLYAVGEDHVTAYRLTDLSVIGRVDFGTGSRPDLRPLQVLN